MKRPRPFWHTLVSRQNKSRDSVQQDALNVLKGLQRTGRFGRLLLKCIAVSFCLLVPIVLLEKTTTVWHSLLLTLHVLFFWLLIASLLLFFVTTQLSFFNASRRRYINAALNEIDDMSALGMLVDALDVVNTVNKNPNAVSQSPGRDVPNAVAEALKRLLCKIKDEDAHFLNARQFKRLHRALSPVASSYSLQ